MPRARATSDLGGGVQLRVATVVVDGAPAGAEEAAEASAAPAGAEEAAEAPVMVVNAVEVSPNEMHNEAPGAVAVPVAAGTRYFQQRK